jgi:hypothetical protein
MSGYLEIVNKSDEMCALKILLPGGNELFEVPRPSYSTLPPGETCHTEFDSSVSNLFVIILFNSPHKIPAATTPLIYDTSAAGVTAKKISACAKISSFLDFVIFKISCRSHNVLLKYQKGGKVAPRLGNSVSRVGVLSALQGKQFAKNRIDFATNISSIDVNVEVQGSSAKKESTPRADK